MRNALRIHVALSEFVVGAICLTLLVGSVAYFKTRPSPAPVKADCSSEPTVTISQIIYYVPTTPVTVKVRVKVEQPKPAGSSSKDTQIPDAAPQDETDPVFQHRTPIITSALRTPMSELDQK